MTKGPCPLESRPRGDTPCAVVRSTGTLRSPLDFVSGYGLVTSPFRAGPTRSYLRRALDRTPERGNETACTPTAAASEPVASRLHTAHPVERSVLYCLALASGVPQGGTPWVDSFPYFLANQEIGPPEASRKDFHILQYQSINKSIGRTEHIKPRIPPSYAAVSGESERRSARLCRTRPGRSRHPGSVLPDPPRRAG